VGYTKRGLKPCLHPLLAVLAEARLVAQLWLRPGNTSCGGNATAFFLDLWENLPSHLRLRGVRADSGFCLPELLALWEELRLPYVVVARLSQPIQKILKGGLKWTATEVPGNFLPCRLITPARRILIGRTSKRRRAESPSRDHSGPLSTRLPSVPPIRYAS